MIKINYKLIYAGHCTHPEWVTIRGGKWGSVPFPAMCAWLQHPSFGDIIFDTGYANSFFEGTKKFPLSLYPRFTPVFLKEGEDLISQLQQYNVDPQKVQKVILSHFHADHMCALSDFTNADYICSRKGYEAIRGLSGMAGLIKGFLPNLLPSDFEKRASYIEDCQTQNVSDFLAPFSTAQDIFGDGSVLAIPLPGHATAQFGIFFTMSMKYLLFLLQIAVGQVKHIANICCHLYLHILLWIVRGNTKILCGSCTNCTSSFLK